MFCCSIGLYPICANKESDIKYKHSFSKYQNLCKNIKLVSASVCYMSSLISIALTSLLLFSFQCYVLISKIMSLFVLGRC